MYILAVLGGGGGVNRWVRLVEGYCLYNIFIQLKLIPVFLSKDWRASHKHVQRIETEQTGICSASSGKWCCDDLLPYHGQTWRSLWICKLLITEIPCSHWKKFSVQKNIKEKLTVSLSNCCLYIIQYIHYSYSIGQNKLCILCCFILFYF